MTINIKDISQNYNNQKTNVLALENINLDVKKGEFICIVGPSGCGKSTLLNMIAGLISPTKGKILVNNSEITSPDPNRILMFQESALFPWLTVIENVEFGLKMRNIDEKKRRSVALEHLKLVHLSKFKDSYVHELSGGMKQRVALARALATDPDILLMDEPFAALDAQTRDNFHIELQQIWSKTKKTIIFVTHNVSEAVCLGDRVIVMTYRPGRIKSEFKVHYPRPRRYRDNPELAKISSDILDSLKDEIDKATKVELG